MPIGIYIRTEEAKQNIRLSKIGSIPWNKGIKLSDQQKAKLNMSGLTRDYWKGKKGILKANDGSFKKGEHRSKKTEFKKGQRSNPEGEFKKGFVPWCKTHKDLMPKGEGNKKWKGDKVGYDALHRWVYRQLGKPKFCSKNKTHISKRYVWANISGEYERDLNDFHSLCNSCNLKDGVKISTRFMKL